MRKTAAIRFPSRAHAIRPTDEGDWKLVSYGRAQRPLVARLMTLLMRGSRNCLALLALASLVACHREVPSDGEEPANIDAAMARVEAIQKKADEARMRTSHAPRPAGIPGS